MSLIDIVEKLNWQKLAVIVVVATVTVLVGGFVLRDAANLEGNHVQFVVNRTPDGCMMSIDFHVGDAIAADSFSVINADDGSCHIYRSLVGLDFEGQSGVSDSLHKLVPHKGPDND